jgi:RNA polymerase sigma-70 factor (ECF subfamily)
MASPEGRGHLNADELFRQHGRFVARFLLRLGVAPEDLEDVVQEVFLVVHAQGGYAPGPAKPTSWLGCIALKAASTDRRRRRSARDRRSPEQPEELDSPELNPAQRLEQRERQRTFEAALATLSPVLRATLLLADREGESCGSIAASMGVPLGTVYWRLHQARRTFKRALCALHTESQEDEVPASIVQKGAPS